MKGHNYWSYRPYRPFFFEVGEPYICRVAPGKYAIHFEWLAEESCTYEIYFRERGEGNFTLAGKTSSNEFDIVNLENSKDYEFFVSYGEKKSRVRIARTGACVGTPVNYLHPEDGAYAFSGRFLCSPSLVRHPEGFLLASMDLFEGNSPQNLTLIFRSDDEGKTWHYVSELMPCFWGKMFIHKGELYMLGCSTEYGDLLIGKSTDGGKTFSAPVTLLRGANGKNGSVGVHKNPQNVLYHSGRIWGTLEWGSWGAGYHAPMVMSCAEDADLLCPENWEFTPPVKYNPEWEGVAKGKSTGNIEGTLAIAPNGKLYNIMRYDMSKTEPNYGLVLAYEVNTQDPAAPLEYSHAVSFPANHSKFMIKRDGKTGKYYTLASRITDPTHVHDRNLLSLMVSDDLKNWEVVRDIIDIRHLDRWKNGVQYVDFEIEGKEIIFLCRTAINGADSFHNTNHSTFHRIKI
ncbi:MAG: exo-alpha-sialidase [Clostridia bacterium]|nr:exo-alpha-sialidase [Clostridia bacterium]